MNFSGATVRQGDSSATFTITLPQWSGLASVNKKVLGKPKSLSFSPVGDRKVHYSLTYWVKYPKNYYPFFIRADDISKNKALAVGQKLQNHYIQLGGAFPLLESLPRLAYIQEGEDVDRRPHFELELPPRSAFYSNTEHFFVGLGFGKNRRLQVMQKTMSVASVVGYRDVYGFENTGYTTQTYTSHEMQPGVSMNQVLGLENLPKELFLQAELLDSKKFEVTSPLGQFEPDLATGERAAVLLPLLLERIRLQRDWKNNPFEVVLGVNDTVHLSNKATRAANMKVYLQLGPELCDAFGMSPTQAMSFPLDVVSTYDLNLRSRGDPFARLRPVILQTNSFGSAISYIDGSGYQPILGVLLDHSNDQQQEFYSTGVVFDTDKTYMTIDFLDKNRQRITFKDDLNLSLLMTFKSL
jgi:hypothetical protein